jgi:hypothetical protein
MIKSVRAWTRSGPKSRGAEPMAKAEMIVFGSPEYACLHEAGHAEAALRQGARAIEMHLYRDPERCWGRTRVERREDQASEIAVGGFGVEYRLFRQGRLLQQDGTAPTEVEFIDRAYKNAAEDFPAFWRSTQIPGAGLTDRDRDWIFMNEAIRLATHVMRLDRVERIAAALLAADFLDEAAILKASDDLS